MTTIFIVIWLLMGVLGVMGAYYGYIKHWYLQYNEDIRLTTTNETLKQILNPIFVLSGPVVLVIAYLKVPNFTLYFKIPKK